MEIFDVCTKVSEHLNSGNQIEARNQLIKLLDFHQREELTYTPMVNHLIRETGLFPYLEPSTASWQDRFVYESFKVDIGLDQRITLHREQSLVLKHLMDGDNLAVSAPTSFGKSLVIDAFIASKKPSNIMIIVPTIALTDETRRRLSRKFGRDYKIITTSDVELSERNICIFPQERAIQYTNQFESLDLLVIDEFYKASTNFDKERSPALLKAMIRLGAIAQQKYYLAPNIAQLTESLFTKGMRFLPLDFNTVFLAKHELYRNIKKDQNKKNDALLEILTTKSTKSLIYAGSYTNIDRISMLLVEKFDEIGSEKLMNFSSWLSINYDPNWKLTALVKRGVGVHTGQLHRSLSQIQVRLFEEEDGLHNLVSTSSIIEGVNTSAENVIVWSNKNGRSLLNDFSYRNIIGRGGRMFKHFIGEIYILEEPPKPTDTQLDLTLPDTLLAEIDENEFKTSLSSDQLSKIIQYREEMSQIFGEEAFLRIQKNHSLMSSDPALIREIAVDFSRNGSDWKGLGYLNSSNPTDWTSYLFKILKLSPAGWDGTHTKVVEFIKVLSLNWRLPLPDLLDRLEPVEIDIDQFFKLERIVSFKLSALLNDVNVIQKEILPHLHLDLSPFIAKLSHAFLPSCVSELEEYGLPRMLSKRIQQAELINFEHPELKLHQAISKLTQVRAEIMNLPALHSFDRYVIDYFFDGVISSS